LLAEVLARLDQVEARLARLEAGRGPRDQADLRLVHAMTSTTEGLPFKAQDVLQRAQYVPALREALLGADITSARQLGKLLARLEGTVVDGARLDRGRLTGGAYYWQVVQVLKV
jgi:hypothetical protein